MKYKKNSKELTFWIDTQMASPKHVAFDYYDI